MSKEQSNASQSKKRKKPVYADEDPAPNKRLKASVPANDQSSVNAAPENRAPDDDAASLTNIIATSTKKKKRIKKKKAADETNGSSVAKSSHSPLLLIIFGLIRKCRQDKTVAKMTSSVRLVATAMRHSMLQSYYKIEVSASSELHQQDVDNLEKTLSSNFNETVFASLDRTIQIRTVERSSGISKEWLFTEDPVSGQWLNKSVRASVEQTKATSTITLFLHGDVLGEIQSLEPVLEECLLFNPFISFSYQVDNNMEIVLSTAAEYKPHSFKNIINHNLINYYCPEDVSVQGPNNQSKHVVHVLLNCRSEVEVDRPFIEVKLIQDGIVALPNQAIVEQLLNKNWNGDHGIGIELDTIIIHDVPVGYYIRTSTETTDSVSNILVIIESNVPCSAFGTDKPLNAIPSMSTGLVKALKELKERHIGLSSKREIAKLTDFQVAAEELTESISSIIEDSSNADFVARCMERLQVRDVNEIRPALQHLIEGSISKFMPLLPKPTV